MPKTRPTLQKRAREASKTERRQAKDAKRSDKASREDRPVSADGEDPDLVGIYAGPQPEPPEDPLAR